MAYNHRFIIWDSEINLKDWKSYLEEEYPEVTDEGEQYNLCQEMNDQYLEDERANLNVDMDILVLADLGLWNGRKQGYRFESNLGQALRSYCNSSSEIKFYVELKDIKCTEYHHDGVNYYTFYGVRKGVRENPNFDKLLEDIANGVKIAPQRLFKYVEHIAYIPRRVYGL